MAKVKVVTAKDLAALAPGDKLATKAKVEAPTEAGLGSLAYSDRIMDQYFSQPIGKKQIHGRDKWSNTALVLVHRAQKAAQTYGKKDFNALYRLVLSAGIAYDKAFPQVQAPQVGNLIVQLFGGLGSGTTRAILEPPRPMLDIEDVVQVGEQADEQEKGGPRAPAEGPPGTPANV